MMMLQIRFILAKKTLIKFVNMVIEFQQNEERTKTTETEKKREKGREREREERKLRCDVGKR